MKPVLHIRHAALISRLTHSVSSSYGLSHRGIFFAALNELIVLVNVIFTFIKLLAIFEERKMCTIYFLQVLSVKYSLGLYIPPFTPSLHD